ncbi:MULTISPECIES: hypothetical protein [unclassified Frankia]|uniref:hypothetical protein n=1 Tax=unclassified Frankia TaxID=2632575 RepID=UPI002AD43BD6|nr:MULTISPECIES: hypothetical protein [unclassified Frankia]
MTAAPARAIDFEAGCEVGNENQSWFLKQNISEFAGKPATVDPADEEFVDLHTPHWPGDTVTAMGMAAAGFRLF